MNYETPLFKRLDNKKQARILKLAGEEFAFNGYTGANINVIAEKIGISVGSLYKYFGTKENLFLSTVIYGRRELEKVLDENSRLPLNFTGKIENLIDVIQQYSQKNRAAIKLYAELTVVKNEELSRKLSKEMEKIAADYYTSLIADAQNSGVITNRMDPAYLALYLDNLFMNLQFSYSGVYYQERMKIFLGQEDSMDNDKVKSSFLNFILAALGVKEKEGS